MAAGSVSGLPIGDIKYATQYLVIGHPTGSQIPRGPHMLPRESAGQPRSWVDPLFHLHGFCTGTWGPILPWPTWPACLLRRIDGRRLNADTLFVLGLAHVGMM
jgi:hypothetical protein